MNADENGSVNIPSMVRIALANLRFPESPEESITLAERAIAEAAEGGAEVVCFPECFVPGYRAPGKSVPPPATVFLERAWAAVADAAGRAGLLASRYKPTE